MSTDLTTFVTTAVPQYLWNTAGQINIESTSDDTEGIPIYKTFMISAHVVTLIIATFGLAGNSLTLLVVFRSKLWETVYGEYIVVLAIANSIVLLGHVPFTVFYMHVFTSGTWIPWTWLLVYFCMVTSGTLLSSWVIVLISIQRFIKIGLSVRASHVCNHVKTRIAMLVIMLFAFSFSLYVILSKDTVSKAFQTIYAVTTVLIPIILVSFFTVLTLCVLARDKRSTPQLSRNQSQESAAALQERQITASLTIIAVVFVLLRLPDTIVYFYFDTVEVLTEWMIMIATVTYDIGLINYACSFCIFYLHCSLFKQQLRVVFCKRCQTDNPT